MHLSLPPASEFHASQGRYVISPRPRGLFSIFTDDADDLVVVSPQKFPLAQPSSPFFFSLVATNLKIRDISHKNLDFWLL